MGQGGRRVRPSQCRKRMREAIAEDFEGIVKGFLSAAKKGSVPHVKLATELLEPSEEEKRKKAGSARRLLRKLSREAAES